MNQPAQHISPNPALDFAQSILEETNNALELIEILRDISEGSGEHATTNDRISAANTLADRAFGKPPKQTFPNVEPKHDPDDNAVKALREAPSTGPESPRLVTQIDDSLNQSLGPAPGAPQSAEAGFKPDQSPDQEDPEPSDPYSIHYIIQQHILAITNNGQALRDTLLEIARAEDDPKVKPCHRRRAVTLLLGRALGADPNAVRSAVCPDCRQSHPGSPDHSESHRKVSPGRPVRYVDPELLAEARADIQRMKDEGILTPDPNAPLIDISKYRMPKDFDSTPYREEEAASFWAKVELQLERQKAWPEIEERRRKKLAQMYPSHSDGDPPDP